MADRTTFVIRTIAALAFALLVGCGDDDNENENNNSCPAGQVREGNRCVAVGNNNGNANNDNNNDNNNATADGCTDSDASNFDDTATMDDGSCLYAVTVTIDLSASATPSPAAVALLVTAVGGTEPSTVAMTEGMTGMWSGVIDLPPGDYTFRIDVGDSVTPPGSFTVVDAPITVNAGALGDIVASLPFVLSDAFGPAGFFPDADDQDLLTDCADRPTDARGACYHFTYSESGDTECGPVNSPDCGFAGVQWLDGSSFADATPVAIEAGANQISFYAWGNSGGEVVQFGFDPTSDGSGAGGGSVTETLTMTPTRYTVRINDSYDRVLYPFFWSAEADVNFWITDIVWEFDEEVAPIDELPLAVDDAFPGRGGFGPARTGDAPLHTEDDQCPVRAAPSGRDPAGVCHRFVWASADVMSGDFTGAIWVDGTGFGDAQAVDLPNGAPAIQFYAWAEDDGEMAEFGAGDSGLGDIAQVRELFTLSTAPELFTLPLGALSGYETITGGFEFAMTQANNPDGGTVYVDDIRYIDESPDIGCTDPNAKNQKVGATIDDGSCLYDLTFTVDMGCPDAVDGSDMPIGEVTGFTNVQLTGGFCGFCTDIVLTDNTDGTYSVTLTDLNVPGDTFEYLYITDDFTSKERLFDEAGMCAIDLNTDGTSFGNRLIDPVDGMTYTDVYGQCSACPDPNGPIMESVTANASDGNVLDNGGISDQNEVIGKVGYFGDTGPQSNFVFAFELPSSLRQDDEVTAASVAIQLLNKVGTFTFGADLYGIGFRSDPALQASDATGGTELQVDFLTSDLADSTVVSASGTAVVDFLNAEISGGALPGDFVFFRVEPNANVGTGERIYQVFASEQVGADAKPVLNFTAECMTCDPYMLGCTDNTAVNYDPAANVDDGSCFYEDFPIIVSDFFAPNGPFGGSYTTIACPERGGMGRGTCYGIDYDGNGGFTGDNFGTIAGGTLPLPPGVTQVSFVAWSPDVGSGLTDARFFVRAPAGNEITSGWFQLPAAPGARTIIPITNEPAEVEVGFGWVLEANGANGTTNGPIYFDDIIWDDEPLSFGTFPLPERTVGTTDSDVEVDSGGGIVENVGNPSLLREGRRDGLGSAVVIPLEIPDTGGASFTAADIDFSVRDATGTIGDFDFNVSIYGLPYRPADTVQATDYDAMGELIQADILTPSSAALTDYTLDAGGEAALLGYLNQQVTNGAQPGDFVFIRLSPEPIVADPWPAGPELQWWFIWGVETLETENPFTLSYDTQ